MSESLRCRLLERGPDGKPSFAYVKHDNTDIRILFDRIRAELAPKRAANVRALRKAKT